MKVKLVSYTQPSPELIDGVNTYDLEDLVSYCARVSNSGKSTVTNRRLLKYLIKHKHWSPFEMVNICLSIETTRDIARQILRHRSFSFQEFSQRYADPTCELSFEERDARLQDTSNRQNSLDCQDLNLDAEWKYKQRVLINAADDTYRWARSRGIAKEQARVVLPEGCTVSRMYMNGSLRSWIHYIQVRDEVSTQREHQEVANACKDVIAEIFPLINDVLEKAEESTDS
jgi:thymidylate synthase (FAD)